jgi:ketosteroid isomerase-like protein/quinol monooxygenase YgiN
MIITLEFTVQSGSAQKVAELASQTLASARDWDGCLAIKVGFSEEADVVFVLEHWLSDDHAEKYREWRRATVTRNLLEDSGLLSAAPVRRVFSEVPQESCNSVEAENREVVERFLRSFATGDTDAIVGHMSDDATYWVSGSREGTGTGVATPKSAFAEMHRRGADLYVDRRLEIVPKAWTVQGERVAVEAQGFSELTNGRRHDNTYHFLFVVRDGKIAEVREYNDTDLMFRSVMP